MKCYSRTIPSHFLFIQLEIRAEMNIKFSIQIVWIIQRVNNSNSLNMLFCLNLCDLICNCLFKIPW